MASTSGSGSGSHTGASSSHGPPNPCNDIRNTSKSIMEICSSLGDLSNGSKYSLLFQHVSPPDTLPQTYSHGCNRKFNTSLLEKFPWLRHSPTLDGVFCGACALFLDEDKRKDNGALVNKPFSNWVKLNDVLKTHSKHLYHRDALQSAEVLKSTIENPASRLDIMVSSALQSRIAENKHILQQIVRAIVFLAKQGLPFRGDVEDVSSGKNPGNFLALLAMLAESDNLLYRHLHQPRARNATYLSPRSQNDIISIIGYDIVRSKILSEVRKARFYSILADEVSSHNIEHLCLCLRYVDDTS